MLQPSALRRALHVIAALLIAAPLIAQDVRGRVTDDAGRPLIGARVTLQREEVTQQARTDSTGSYVVAGLRQGQWRVTVQRLGYVPDSADVAIAAATLTHDVRLQRIVQLDQRIVSADWTGVIGVVGDRDYQRVPEATVTVVGERVGGRVDANSSFAIPWPGNQSILLRVKAPGFADRLVSARIPERGSVELSVLLDTARVVRASALIADELERRMNWASPTAARVSREELLRVGSRDAMAAISSTPSFTAKGLIIDRDACLFVNGQARPGFPLDAIDPATIEFIEVYPSGADRTGLLASRWPRGAPCGVPIPAPFKRRAGPEQMVRYVVVWTR